MLWEERRDGDDIYEKGVGEFLGGREKGEERGEGCGRGWSGRVRGSGGSGRKWDGVGWSGGVGEWGSGTVVEMGGRA